MDLRILNCGSYSILNSAMLSAYWFPLFSQPNWMQVRGSVFSFNANLPVALLGFPRGIAN